MKRIKVVCGIIYNDKRKIFIARKKEGKHLSGYWEFPGGKIKPNETNEDALIREIHEELNMDILIAKYIGSNIHQYENLEVNLIAYECKYMPSNIRLLDHDAFRWVDKSEVTQYLISPADLPLIELIDN